MVSMKKTISTMMVATMALSSIIAVAPMSVVAHAATDGNVAQSNNDLTPHFDLPAQKPATTTNNGMQLVDGTYTLNFDSALLDGQYKNQSAADLLVGGAKSAMVVVKDGQAKITFVAASNSAFKTLQSLNLSLGTSRNAQGALQDMLTRSDNSADNSISFTTAADKLANVKFVGLTIPTDAQKPAQPGQPAPDNGGVQNVVTPAKPATPTTPATPAAPTATNQWTGAFNFTNLSTAIPATTYSLTVLGMASGDANHNQMVAADNGYFAGASVAAKDASTYVMTVPVSVATNELTKNLADKISAADKAKQPLKLTDADFMGNTPISLTGFTVDAASAKVANGKLSYNLVKSVSIDAAKGSANAQFSKAINGDVTLTKHLLKASNGTINDDATAVRLGLNYVATTVATKGNATDSSKMVANPAGYLIQAPTAAKGYALKGATAFAAINGTVTFNYAKNAVKPVAKPAAMHKITVKYVNAATGKAVASTKVVSAKTGANVVVEARSIKGHHLVSAKTVTLTTTKDQTVTFKYNVKSYKLTVKYDNKSGKKIAANKTYKLAYKSTKKIAAKHVKGYKTPKAIKVTMKNSVRTITFHYGK